MLSNVNWPNWPTKQMLISAYLSSWARSVAYCSSQQRWVVDSFITEISLENLKHNLSLVWSREPWGVQRQFCGTKGQDLLLHVYTGYLATQQNCLKHICSTDNLLSCLAFVLVYTHFSSRQYVVVSRETNQLIQSAGHGIRTTAYSNRTKNPNFSGVILDRHVLVHGYDNLHHPDHFDVHPVEMGLNSVPHMGHLRLEYSVHRRAKKCVSERTPYAPSFFVYAHA